MTFVSRRLRRFYERVRFEWLAGAPPYRLSLELGRQAASKGDWAAAVRCFELAVQARPSAVAAHLKLGSSYSALGDDQSAERVFRNAVRHDPRAPDALLALARYLRGVDKGEEATALFEKVRQLSPQLTSLERYGLGESRVDRSHSNLNALIASEHRRELQARDLLWRSRFDISAWASFRNSRSLTLPSQNPAHQVVPVLIDARKIPPDLIRSCLLALCAINQPEWRALVISDTDAADHPVASIAQVDARIRFCELSDPDVVSFDSGVIVTDGAILEPDSIAWYALLAQDSRPTVRYGDHDHHVMLWQTGRMYAQPVLAPQFGRYDMASTPAPPSVIFVHECGSVFEILSTESEDVCRKLILRHSATGGIVEHVPILISSVPSRAEFREEQTFSTSLSESWSKARIQVVIPTRDHSDLLKAAVVSLYDKSSLPESISVTIIDNGSVDQKTIDDLGELSKRYGCHVVRIDGPFNWSRLNNIGASKGEEEILVFANNDIEMISSGWDDFVRETLSDPSVGVAGARLLYPDDTVQHVGVALGAVSGRPVHEGRAAHASNAGYLDRWVRTREVAAVTGAFLATSRSTFDAVSGFSEVLAVAYNDLDYCLRVRKAGMSVLFLPKIEAIHYESKTRGLSTTAAKVAWDDGEFRTLVEFWGEAAISDPYVNKGLLMDEFGEFVGYKFPSLIEILERGPFSPPHVLNSRMGAVKW